MKHIQVFGGIKFGKLVKQVYTSAQPPYNTNRYPQLQMKVVKPTWQYTLTFRAGVPLLNDMQPMWPGI